MQSLAQFKMVSVIEMMDLKITDAGLLPLASMPHLVHLYLQNNPITDRGLETLAAIPTMKELNLAGTKITDSGVQKFKAPVGQIAKLSASIRAASPCSLQFDCRRPLRIKVSLLEGRLSISSVRGECVACRFPSNSFMQALTKTGIITPVEADTLRKQPAGREAAQAMPTNSPADLVRLEAS